MSVMQVHPHCRFLAHYRLAGPARLSWVVVSRLSSKEPIMTFRTEPGEGHETVVCPECDERIGGDEPTCPFCDAELWESDENEEGGGWFACTGCDEAFLVYDDEHGELPDWTRCEHCNTGYAIPKEQYKSHEYSGSARLCCSGCGITFRLKKGTDEELDEKDSSLEPAECVRCGKAAAYPIK